MARLGSSNTDAVSFVSASSAPENCPQRSTRVRSSRSSWPSSSHSFPAASTWSRVRGRSSRVLTLSFSNSSMARSAFDAARSAASEADCTARSAGAMMRMNAVPHAPRDATAARPIEATRGQPPTVMVAVAVGVETCAVAPFPDAASCDTARLGTDAGSATRPGET